MPFRVKKGDIIIEVDTLSELRDILSIFGVRPREIRASSPLDKLLPTFEVHPRTLQEKLDIFIKQIQNKKGYMLGILENLSSSTEGLTDSELRSKLELKTNSALAGAMAGLSKQAAMLGIDFQEIILKEKLNGENGALYKYRLAPIMLAMVDTIIGDR